MLTRAGLQARQQTIEIALCLRRVGAAILPIGGSQQQGRVIERNVFIFDKAKGGNRIDGGRLPSRRLSPDAQATP
jgi:hypothetical protein